MTLYYRDSDSCCSTCSEPRIEWSCFHQTDEPRRVCRTIKTHRCVWSCSQWDGSVQMPFDNFLDKVGFIQNKVSFSWLVWMEYNNLCRGESSDDKIILNFQIHFNVLFSVLLTGWELWGTRALAWCPLSRDGLHGRSWVPVLRLCGRGNDRKHPQRCAPLLLVSFNVDGGSKSEAKHLGNSCCI